ncbi:MAG: hypothetical protein M3Z15_00845 [Pseudomonadota bacterium]|nr:hypothetical protein [Pseudomonadota bacterium]
MAAEPKNTELDRTQVGPGEADEVGRDIASPSHDQWLLDEALAETFPASDPISPSTEKRNQEERSRGDLPRSRP